MCHLEAGFEHSVFQRIPIKMVWGGLEGGKWFKEPVHCMEQKLGCLA